MFAGTEHSHTAIIEEVGLADLVQCLLETFAPEIAANRIAVYSYSRDLREAVLVASTPTQPGKELHTVVEAFCAKGSANALVDGSQLPGLNVAWAQLLLFKIEDEPIGAMVLLSQSKAAKKALSPRLPL